MNCIKDGKFTDDSCFGCKVYAVECEMRDKVYRNRWIPVSEGLPSKKYPDNHVLVSVEYLNEVDEWFTAVTHDHYRDGEWVYYTGKNYKVTAWMPFPEPYKEQLTQKNVNFEIQEEEE